VVRPRVTQGVGDHGGRHVEKTTSRLQSNVAVAHSESSGFTQEEDEYDRTGGAKGTRKGEHARDRESRTLEPKVPDPGRRVAKRDSVTG